MAELETIEHDLAAWVDRELKATEQQRIAAIIALFSSLSDSAKQEALDQCGLVHYLRS